jgi:hypothetical protein
MPDYKCIRSFKSSNTINYYYGNKISSTEYNRLPYSDQNNFQKIYDDESYNTRTGYNSYDSGSSMSFPPTSSDFGNSTDSSSDFSDFGGGDGGGAGAGGDW